MATYEQTNKNLIDEITSNKMSDFFKAFADNTRIKILYTLLDKELCVGELVNILGMSQSSISHQLRFLRQNNLVKFQKKGKSVFYSLDDDHVSVLLKQALDHINHK